MQKIYFTLAGIGNSKAFGKFESIKSDCILINADATIEIENSIRPCDIYEVPANVADLRLEDGEADYGTASTTRVQYIPAVGMADTSEIRLLF